MKKYVEIEVKRNTRSGRVVLIDRKTGVAVGSFDKKDFVSQFFLEHYKEFVTDFKPINI